MDPIQYLNALYNAARLAPLPASDHELVKKAAEAILEVLKPKEAPVVPFEPKAP